MAATTKSAAFALALVPTLLASTAISDAQTTNDTVNRVLWTAEVAHELTVHPAKTAKMVALRYGADLLQSNPDLSMSSVRHYVDGIENKIDSELSGARQRADDTAVTVNAIAGAVSGGNSDRGVRISAAIKTVNSLYGSDIAGNVADSLSRTSAASRIDVYSLARDLNNLADQHPDSRAAHVFVRRVERMAGLQGDISDYDAGKIARMLGANSDVVGLVRDFQGLSSSGSRDLATADLIARATRQAGGMTAQIGTVVANEYPALQSMISSGMSQTGGAMPDGQHLLDVQRRAAEEAARQFAGPKAGIEILAGLVSTSDPKAGATILRTGTAIIKVAQTVDQLNKVMKAYKTAKSVAAVASMAQMAATFNVVSAGLQVMSMFQGGGLTGRDQSAQMQMAILQQLQAVMKAIRAVSQQISDGFAQQNRHYHDLTVQMASYFAETSAQLNHIQNSVNELNERQSVIMADLRFIDEKVDALIGMVNDIIATEENNRLARAETDCITRREDALKNDVAAVGVQSVARCLSAFQSYVNLASNVGGGMLIKPPGSSTPLPVLLDALRSSPLQRHYRFLAVTAQSMDLQPGPTGAFVASNVPNPEAWYRGSRDILRLFDLEATPDWVNAMLSGRASSGLGTLTPSDLDAMAAAGTELLNFNAALSFAEPQNSALPIDKAFWDKVFDSYGGAANTLAEVLAAKRQQAITNAVGENKKRGRATVDLSDPDDMRLYAAQFENTKGPGEYAANIEGAKCPPIDIGGRRRVSLSSLSGPWPDLSFVGNDPDADRAWPDFVPVQFRTAAALKRGQIRVCIKSVKFGKGDAVSWEDLRTIQFYSPVHHDFFSQLGNMFTGGFHTTPPSQTFDSKFNEVWAPLSVVFTIDLMNGGTPKVSVDTVPFMMGVDTGGFRVSTKCTGDPDEYSAKNGCVDWNPADKGADNVDWTKNGPLFDLINQWDPGALVVSSDTKSPWATNDGIDQIERELLGIRNDAIVKNGKDITSDPPVKNAIAAVDIHRLLAEEFMQAAAPQAFATDKDLYAATRAMPGAQKLIAAFEKGASGQAMKDMAAHASSEAQSEFFAKFRYVDGPQAPAFVADTVARLKADSRILAAIIER